MGAIQSDFITHLSTVYRFNDFRFVRVKEINTEDLPLLPQEFEGLVRKHCAEAHNILETMSVSYILCRRHVEPM